MPGSLLYGIEASCYTAQDHALRAMLTHLSADALLDIPIRLRVERRNFRLMRAL